MKRIIVAAVVVLLLLIVVISIITRLNNIKQNSTTVYLTPTTVPVNYENIENSALLESAKIIAPYETESFTYDYSSELDKMLVLEKNSSGYADFVNWTSEVGLSEIAGNPEIVAYQAIYETSQQSAEADEDPETEKPAVGSTITQKPSETVSPTPNFNPFIELIDIFLNLGLGTYDNQEYTESNISTSISISPSPVSSNIQTNKIYFAQCNGYGNISLPSGCNLCEAGCGPTTVAMIASSYLGSGYNPKQIVDFYEKNNYYLSCAGSRYSDAKTALEKMGLKTTSYMTYDQETSDTVYADFKKYIDAGWTIFTLASFCDNGCGHFFWVTDVKNGNILAYDPYYGKNSTPPINENSRYPFPKYRVAFGVKK